MRNTKRAVSGWSLIELTIILVVLSILCAILAPVIGNFVRMAKICRAREDVQMLGCAIHIWLQDTGLSHFLEDGDDQTSDTVVLLFSDGDVPNANAAYGNVQIEWELAYGPGPNADFFENHLSINDPYQATGVLTDSYLTPFDMGNNIAGAGVGPGGQAGPAFAKASNGFYPEFAWRGPYINNPVDPDPWGNRYMANVIWLDPDSAQTQKMIENDTIVISAGPDEQVDTYYDPQDQEVDQNIPQESVATLGDDIVLIISANVAE